MPEAFPRLSLFVEHRRPGTLQWRSIDAAPGEVAIEETVETTEPNEKIALSLAIPTWLPAEPIAAKAASTVSDSASELKIARITLTAIEPTNSPADRVVWIPIEGVFRMGGHVLRGAGQNYEAKQGEEIPDEHKQVSAVLLKFRGKSLMTGFQFKNRINDQGNVATLAWPIAAVVGPPATLAPPARLHPLRFRNGHPHRLHCPGAVVVPGFARRRPLGRPAARVARRVNLV